MAKPRNRQSRTGRVAPKHTSTKKAAARRRQSARGRRTSKMMDRGASDASSEEREGRTTARGKASIAGGVVPAGAREIPDTAIIDPEIREFGDELSTQENPLLHKLDVHTAQSPELSGGDVDAAWEQDAVGEEMVGGSAPTPDQDNVDEIGRALGVTYEDNEPLRTEEKLEKRDRERWELNPVSSEDFDERRRVFHTPPPRRQRKTTSAATAREGKGSKTAKQPTRSPRKHGGGR